MTDLITRARKEWCDDRTGRTIPHGTFQTGTAKVADHPIFTSAEVETLQRKIRKLESQLRIFRKANRGKCLPAKGQTGKHATRMALVQSVMAAGMAGRTPQRIAADEGVSTTVIYNILAQYGGAIALRKRKA